MAIKSIMHENPQKTCSCMIDFIAKVHFSGQNLPWGINLKKKLDRNVVSVPFQIFLEDGV